MSAAGLIHARLVTAAGVSTRVCPDIRSAGTALPCCVYTVVRDERIGVLDVSASASRALVHIDVIGESLGVALLIAAAIATSVHGATWSASGEGTARAAIVMHTSTGVVDDPTPGRLDAERIVAIELNLIHTPT